MNTDKQTQKKKNRLSHQPITPPKLQESPLVKKSQQRDPRLDDEQLPKPSIQHPVAVGTDIEEGSTTHSSGRKNGVIRVLKKGENVPAKIFDDDEKGLLDNQYLSSSGVEVRPTTMQSAPSSIAVPVAVAVPSSVVAPSSVAVPANTEQAIDKAPQSTVNSEGGEISDTCEDEIDPILLQALANPKNQAFLLKVYTELERFINNRSATCLPFPHMNSFHRLMVHRVADYFKLEHRPETNGDGDRVVVLYKKPQSRIPVLRFSDLCEKPCEEQPKLQIMKRETPPRILMRPPSIQGSGGQMSGSGGMRSAGPQNGTGGRDCVHTNDPLDQKEVMSRTVATREEEYAKARALIFDDDDDQDEKHKNGIETKSQTPLSQSPSPSSSSSSSVGQLRSPQSGGESQNSSSAVGGSGGGQQSGGGGGGKSMTENSSQSSNQTGKKKGKNKSKKNRNKNSGSKKGNNATGSPSSGNRKNGDGRWKSTTIYEHPGMYDRRMKPSSRNRYMYRQQQQHHVNPPQYTTYHMPAVPIHRVPNHMMMAAPGPQVAPMQVPIYPMKIVPAQAVQAAVPGSAGGSSGSGPQQGQPQEGKIQIQPERIVGYDPMMAVNGSMWQEVAPQHIVHQSHNACRINMEAPIPVPHQPPPTAIHPQIAAASVGAPAAVIVQDSGHHLQQQHHLEGAPPQQYHIQHHLQQQHHQQQGGSRGIVNGGGRHHSQVPPVSSPRIRQYKQRSSPSNSSPGKKSPNSYISTDVSAFETNRAKLTLFDPNERTSSNRPPTTSTPSGTVPQSSTNSQSSKNKSLPTPQHHHQTPSHNTRLPTKNASGILPTSRPQTSSNASSTSSSPAASHRHRQVNNPHKSSPTVQASSRTANALMFDYSRNSGQPYVAPEPPSKQIPPHILEVYDLADGIKNYEADILLEDVKRAGGKIKWLREKPQLIVVVFDSAARAKETLEKIRNDRFKLRPWSGKY